MLRQLLNEIESGGTLDVQVLAARLDTTPQLVAAMLDHLERMGWIQSLSECASQGCGGCSLANSCSPKNTAGRVWRLVGRRT